MKAEDYKKPFGSYPSIKTFLTVPFHPVTAKATAGLIKSAWKNFFVLQTKQKLKITKRRVVSVDHEFDGLIPFIPKNVKIYLDFVWFFCRIMAMLIKKLGVKKAAVICREIIQFITSLYENASSIYKYAMTTTKRPHYYGKFKFIVIHLFDPHLLCVPSLHVAIVTGVWAKVRELMTTYSAEFESLCEEEKKQILSDIYYGTLAITESVLFVKQHSINCIAGALYMLTAAYKPEVFTTQDAATLIEQLFLNDDQIQSQDASKIRTYIAELYNSLITKNGSAAEWQEPLFAWLDEYKAT